MTTYVRPEFSGRGSAVGGGPAWNGPKSPHPNPAPATAGGPAAGRGRYDPMTDAGPAAGSHGSGTGPCGPPTWVDIPADITELLDAAYAHDAMTIGRFCKRHGLSEASYYRLRRDGQGPSEMRLSEKIVLISREAAAEWRARHSQPPVDAA